MLTSLDVRATATVVCRATVDLGDRTRGGYRHPTNAEYQLGRPKPEQRESRRPYRAAMDYVIPSPLTVEEATPAIRDLLRPRSVSFEEIDGKIRSTYIPVPLF